MARESSSIPTGCIMKGTGCLIKWTELAHFSILPENHITGESGNRELSMGGASSLIKMPRVSMVSSVFGISAKLARSGGFLKGISSRT